MTPNEWIAIMQTLVLAGTGVVVLWYTYETRRIRKETSRQNNILGEQLVLLRAQLDREREEQASLLLPRFNSAGGMMSGSNIKLKFRNEGASIYDVEIIPEGDIKASTQTREHIPSQGQIQVEANWGKLPKPDEICVRVEFTDGADQRRAVRLRYQMGKGYVKQELIA